MLFSVLDEPATFEAGLARFKAEIHAQLADTYELQTKSAKQLGEEARKSAPKPAAKPTPGAKPSGQTFQKPMVIRGPKGQSGKLAPGYPVPEGWTVIGPYPGGQ
jgi:hypothetical protein